MFDYRDGELYIYIYIILYNIILNNGGCWSGVGLKRPVLQRLQFVL